MLCHYSCIIQRIIVALCFNMEYARLDLWNGSENVCGRREIPRLALHKPRAPACAGPLSQLPHTYFCALWIFMMF